MKNGHSQADIRKSFPDWLPEHVVRWYNPQGHAKDAQGADAMLYRLFTYDVMENVWKSVSCLKSYGHVNPENHATLFVSAVLRSFAGPTSFLEKKTPASRQVWQEDVVKHAEQLAALLKGSELDGFINGLFCAHYLNKITPAVYAAYARRKAQWYGQPCDQIPSSDTPSPDIILTISTSKMLQLLAESASTVINDLETKQPGLGPSSYPHFVSRPGATETKRAYFVRALTQHFRKMHHQPWRKLVRDTAIVVFDDPNITERQITRLAP